MTQDDSVVPSYNPCHDNMADNQNAYTITLHAAAALLGVSERTIQRHARSGRLSSIYVRGRKGRELRFQKDEVLKFSTTVSSHVADSHHDSHDTNASSDRYSLNINELLTRHEQAMFQLGQMQAKMNELKMLEERATSLAVQNQTLSTEKGKLDEEKRMLESKMKALEESLRTTTQRFQVTNLTYSIMLIILALVWFAYITGSFGLLRDRLVNIIGLTH